MIEEPRVIFADVLTGLRRLKREGVKARTVITSPPYYALRDYGTATWVGGDPACAHEGPSRQSTASTLKGNGHGGDKPLSPALQTLKMPYTDVCRLCGARRTDDQLGHEPTPEAYVRRLVRIFRAVREVLEDDGTVWINIGDTYASSGGVGSGGNLLRMGRSREQRNVRTGRKSYRGKAKDKDLLGIPWMLAFALRADGWFLRQDVIWSKPNPTPESVGDRLTRAHEYVFLLSKSGKPTVWRSVDTKEWTKTPDRTERVPNPSRNPDAVKRRPMVRRWAGFDYYFDVEAIEEEAIWKPGGTHDDVLQGGFNDKGATPGWESRSFRAIRETRRKRSVWTVATVPFKGAHFATFPPKLIEPALLAGSAPGDLVLDPFLGSGTTAAVAMIHGRRSVGIELNREYEAYQAERFAKARAELERQRVEKEEAARQLDMFAVAVNG